MPLLTPSTSSSTVRYYVTPPYILPNTCCQGFGHLVAAFTEQNVTHDMLPELSDNDMRELKNLRFSPIYDTIFTVKKCQLFWTTALLSILQGSFFN